MPPRLRQQFNRSNKDKRGQTHFGQGSQGPSVQSARRSTSHQPHRSNTSTTNNAALNGPSNLPQQNRGGAPGPSQSSGHESRVDRNSKDFTNKQSNADLPHVQNRGHGAHRNSVSMVCETSIRPFINLQCTTRR